MSILLSNDDGIHAKGIRVLHESVKDFDDLIVVAPGEEQSAVGHAITLFDPIKAHPVSEDGKLFGYAVGGTPVDCVKLALCELLDTPPSLLLSGINLGPNTGISVIYSGTVSAATEATILGIPSIAFSLTTFTDPLWKTAAHVARHVTGYARERTIPDRTLLNVNIPNLPLDAIRGYRVTRMAHSRFIEKFHRRSDPRGNTYYWLDGEMELLEDAEGTDQQAVQEGYVSITPIGLDMTRHAEIDRLKSWDFEWKA